MRLTSSIGVAAGRSRWAAFEEAAERKRKKKVQYACSPGLPPWVLIAERRMTLKLSSCFLSQQVCDAENNGVKFSGFGRISIGFFLSSFQL